MTTEHPGQICPNCGSHIESGIETCSNCGWYVASLENPVSQPPVIPKRKATSPLLILVVSGLVIGPLGFLFMFSGGTGWEGVLAVLILTAFAGAILWLTMSSRRSQ